MANAIWIKHPEWLEVQLEDHVSYGYDQEWYETDWQRLAGCGPTTATQLINYISFRDGYLQPQEYTTKEKALASMEQVWNFVQPRHGGGLFKTRWQFEGLSEYIAEHKWPYHVEMLRIMPFMNLRPPLETVEAFMANAFAEDSPIAFLNRHKGQEEGLQTWHWVPLLGMEKKDDELFGFVYDDQLQKKFSMTKWLRRSFFGGGLVYIGKGRIEDGVV